MIISVTNCLEKILILRRCFWRRKTGVLLNWKKILRARIFRLNYCKRKCLSLKANFLISLLSIREKIVPY